jgi:hypothetical protein
MEVERAEITPIAPAVTMFYPKTKVAISDDLDATMLAISNPLPELKIVDDVNLHSYLATTTTTDGAPSGQIESSGEAESMLGDDGAFYEVRRRLTVAEALELMTIVDFMRGFGKDVLNWDGSLLTLGESFILPLQSYWLQWVYF